MTNVTLITKDEDVTYDMEPNRNDLTAVGTSEMDDAIIAKIREA